jgi:hypothetical protein
MLIFLTTNRTINSCPLAVVFYRLLLVVKPEKNLRNL